MPKPPPYAPPLSFANAVYWLIWLAALWVLEHMVGIGNGSDW